jgi:hypothetical protein
MKPRIGPNTAKNETSIRFAGFVKRLAPRKNALMPKHKIVAKMAGPRPPANAANTTTGR